MCVCVHMYKINILISFQRQVIVDLALLKMFIKLIIIIIRRRMYEIVFISESQEEQEIKNNMKTRLSRELN